MTLDTTVSLGIILRESSNWGQTWQDRSRTARSRFGPRAEIFRPPLPLCQGANCFGKLMEQKRLLRERGKRGWGWGEEEEEVAWLCSFYPPPIGKGGGDFSVNRRKKEACGNTLQFSCQRRHLPIKLMEAPCQISATVYLRTLPKVRFNPSPPLEIMLLSPFPPFLLPPPTSDWDCWYYLKSWAKGEGGGKRERKLACFLTKKRFLPLLYTKNLLPKKCRQK